MKTNIVFLNEKPGATDLVGRLLTDLERDERVKVYFSYTPLKSNILKAIRRVHFSHKINSKIRLPFKRIWGCVLDKLDWYDDRTNYLLMFNGTLDYLDFGYLDKLRKKHHIKIVMILVDAFLASICKNMRTFSKKYGFDYIYTFDPKDEETYGFMFHTIPYSTFEELRGTEIQYDFGFVGSNKGRISMINSILESANDAHVSFRARLVHVKSNDRLSFPNIVYNTAVDYKQTVFEELQCNCLLDVLSEGQSGATLRYYEAVVYNRKLLTNNTDVKDLPFYDPDYIHIFAKPEDIDWEWVKARTPVDFHYDGRFSPSCLIDEILQQEK